MTLSIIKDPATGLIGYFAVLGMAFFGGGIRRVFSEAGVRSGSSRCTSATFLFFLLIFGAIFAPRYALGLVETVSI